MKGFNTPDPYRFDELGNLIVDQAESEEQRLAVEAAVLYKEGVSANHPSDIAAHNAAAGEGEAPVEEEGYEGESAADEAARVERNAQTRKVWAARQRSEAAAYPEEEAQEEFVEEAPPEEDNGRRGRRNRNR